MALRKTVIFILIILFTGGVVHAQKDLPNPPADSILISAGSYVIPMDTLLQNVVPIGQAPFNLKSYGLVNRFLQNHIPVKWGIRSGKNIDEIDFSAMAVKVMPVPDTIPAMMDFRAGPFIVVDTSICGQSTYDIIQEFGNDVVVYQLTQSVMADVRYTIVHRPKVAIFINGGNQLIHSKILDEAAIPDYDFIDAANISSLYDCYTFVSEPHWDYSLANPAVITGVKNFVLLGGNFLAQCQAVETYENFGYFMSDLGISLTNVPVTHSYHNPDLAIMQMHGRLFENQGGSVSNWTLAGGSTWNPQTYKLVSYNGSDTVVAMGAHLTAPADTGGNAFFIGSHDYMKIGVNQFDLTNIDRINELRMYLNAVFVPSISNNLWANAGGDKTISCLSSVMLGCTSTAPAGTTITWSPSAGLSCTNCPNPIASPALTTTYIVTITGANGCSVADNVTVNVIPPVVSDFFAAPVCIGTTTSFLDLSTGTITQWNWDFGDGNISSTQSPTHNYSTPGSYAVTLTASNNFGCAIAIQQNVDVNPLPVVGFTSNNACAGSVTCFSDLSAVSPGSISGWDWSFGDPASGTSDTSSSQSPCHNYTTSVPHSATLRITSLAGCVDSVTLPVNFISLPTAGFSGNNVCLHSNTTFSDQSISIGGDPLASWSWNFGDSAASFSQSPIHQYSSAGVKNVSLAVTSSAGCVDTVMMPVIVHDNPSANFSPPVSGCTPLCATFNDLSNTSDGTINSWQWTFPGGNPSGSISRNPSVCYVQPGSYGIDLLVTTSNGCTDYISSTQHVEVHSLPLADFDVDDIGSGYYVPTYSFDGQWSQDVVNWLWDFGDGLVDSTTQNPVHAYSSANTNGHFTCTISVYVENQFGCTDSINKIIEVFPGFSFYIPNTFTPNGDFSNQVFYGKGRGINEYGISIYDRWGNKIWTCHEEGLYTDWDVEGMEGMPSACQWDGKFAGNPVQEDVYVWRVELTAVSGKAYSYTGKVTVIR